MIARPAAANDAPHHDGSLSQVDDQSRIFAPFFDPIDGILFVPAHAAARDVESRIGDHRLRFPLFLDREASLADQILSSSHAPASSRFGPFCDHVVGMNWILPNGRVVRLGERVAKTTTGYDLFRFFLNAGQRFGRPRDLVLRLRPKTDLTMVTHFEGSLQQIRAAAAELLTTCWLHWLDAIDLIAADSKLQLRIQTHCPAHEWSVFESWFGKLARAHHLSLDSMAVEHLLTDGLPDVVVKTTPDQVAELTTSIEKTFGARCVGMCYPAVIHVFAKNASQITSLWEDIDSRYRARLHLEGGDVHSRHRSLVAPAGVESTWINTFLQEAGIQ